MKKLEENTPESGDLTFVFPHDITRAIISRNTRKSEGYLVLIGEMINICSILV
jgi:hypothetical protein